MTHPNFNDHTLVLVLQGHITVLQAKLKGAEAQVERLIEENQRLRDILDLHSDEKWYEKP